MRDCNFTLVVRDNETGENDIYEVIGFETVYDVMDGRQFIEDNRNEYLETEKGISELIEDCANMYNGTILNYEEMYV